MTLRSGMGPVGFCPLPDLLEILAQLCGKRVTLMGLGLCGGGLGAARFLAESGADLTVTDLRPADKLAPTMCKLKALPVRYRLGGHLPEDFTRADLIVANPGVPRTSPYLRLAQQSGVPIASPMNVFLALCPARIAAVSGSNGKSTTTALLARMLKAAGHRVWLGGNIGGSLLPRLPDIVRSDLVVLELSSFQLEDAAWLRWSPHVAVLTNITPNHLDRHGTFASYCTAKRTIVDFQTELDYAVLNAQDTRLRRWHTEEGVNARALFFDAEPHPGCIRPGMSMMGDQLVWHDEGSHEFVCSSHEVRLLGRHNLENALAAAVAAKCIGARTEHIREAFAGFAGLEHRLELVGQRHGVRFFNDSFSTTPDSTVAALESFHGPITLIAGGYDKRLNMDRLARVAALRVEAMVTMGQTGPALAQKTLAASLYLGRSIVIRECESLEHAVEEAWHLSMPGSAVVFSPGCASYDMFENCIHRGELFKRVIRSQFLAPRARSRGA